MGDLNVGETFQDAVYITVTATGAAAVGLAPTCTFVKIANNTRTAGTVQEVGNGWYRVTDFTNDAAGTWATEWAVAGANTIWYPRKIFKAGGGDTALILADTGAIGAMVAAGLAGLGVVDAAVGVIDGFHDVPGQDAVANAQMRDVLGNKTDTTAGTSVIALVKAVKAETDLLLATDAGNLTHDITTGNDKTETQIVEIQKTGIYALSVYFDLDTLEAAGEGGTIKIRLYNKVDGTNYSDKPTAYMEYLVGGENEYPSVELNMVHGYTKLTIICTTDVAATRTIAYRYITRDLGA